MVLRYESTTMAMRAATASETGMMSRYELSEAARSTTSAASAA